MMLTILDGKYKADRSVVALGMFDGVHIGHRVLLERGAALARQKGVPLVVCTFQEHPLSVIAPDKCPPQLTTFPERIRLMEEMGVDVFCAQPFTQDVMETPAADYVGELVRRFHPVDVVCGYNHTYGRKGEGTPALLEVLGGALSFGVSVVPKITLDGQDVSSTVIRSLLARGDAAQARAMLGRPYRLEGQIEKRKGSLCTLRLTESRKQPLHPGDYRALVCTDGKRIPALVRLTEGAAQLRLPAPFSTQSMIGLEFLTNVALPF